METAALDLMGPVERAHNLVVGEISHTNILAVLFASTRMCVWERIEFVVCVASCFSYLALIGV